MVKRAIPAEKLLQKAKKIISDVKCIKPVDMAVKYALKNAGKNDVICISGSLYVVGEAKVYLSKILRKT